jgi:CheY-like chemotaxis protein
MLVMVVENELVSALCVVEELLGAGYAVLGPAVAPDQALDLARREHPQLALVDIDLVCRGDGLELARRLREMNIATLFVSASYMPESQHRHLALGFIGKPYNPADIPPSVAVVAALLAGDRPPKAPRSLQLFG